jgi:hypothetical protein
MLRRVAAALFISAALIGCAVKPPNTCVSFVQEKKTILGEMEKDITCSCSCPPTTSNIIDAGGILGGLINLFSSND